MIKILEDGTVIKPNLHDNLLLSFSQAEQNFTLNFLYEHHVTTQLNFANVTCLHLNIENQFMVFRCSCFNLTQITPKFFYLTEALQQLGVKDLNEIQQENSHYLTYLEGIGTNIILVSEKPTFTQN